MNPVRLRAYIYLLVVAVIWGIAGPVIKLTLNMGIPPDIFLLYRFFISAIAAIIIFVSSGVRLPKSPVLIFQIIIYSILNSTISLGLLFWGTAKTSRLDMSLISIFGPLMVIALGYFFLRDRYTFREKTGTAVALLGSFVVLAEPIFERGYGDGQVIGNLLVLASLVTGAFAGLITKELLRKGVPATDLANISFFVGFLTMIPICLKLHPAGQIIETFTQATPYFYFGIVYMGLFSGTIAYTLSNLGLKSIELSEAALFSYIYPIFSAILAVILLGDKVTPVVIIGSVITLFGVSIAEWKKKRYN